MSKQTYSASTKWPARSVVYQIYPRSFFDATNDGIGDLRGVIEKLDYLKDLGINAVWLSPIYPSPMVDFGYDISDYCDVDPIFGTMDDFERLVKELHQRDIKILMDYVPNHTSEYHPWFKESRAEKNNPKRDWYIWKDPAPGGEEVPNNWLSVFGGTVWEFDAHTGQYYLHSFTKQQPDLNWRNPEVKKAMLDVLRFWMDRGVDGFRMDAVYHIYKDSKWRDNPPNPNFIPGTYDPYRAQLHLYSQTQPETMEVLKEFARLLDSYGNKFMVTEVYASLEIMLELYQVSENGTHSPFNFNLMSLPWNAQAYRAFLEAFEQQLRPDDVPNYVLGNHDRPRVASRMGQNRARLLAMLLFTVRGMPFIYYGEELGMENVEIPKDKIQDPFEKNVPGFGLGRDPSRTPMLWNSEQYAGFSKTTPWLPISSNYQYRNVEAENLDPCSMLSLYKTLIHTRRGHEALLTGNLRTIDTGRKEVLGYIRKSATETFIILLNFSSAEQTVTLPFGQGIIVCNAQMTFPRGGQINLSSMRLAPRDGYLLKISDK